MSKGWGDIDGQGDRHKQFLGGITIGELMRGGVQEKMPCVGTGWVWGGCGVRDAGAWVVDMVGV